MQERFQEGETPCFVYVSSSPEPNTATHKAAATNPVGDGDAAATEIQFTTCDVVTNKPLSDRFRSPLKMRTLS